MALKGDSTGYLTAGCARRRPGSVVLRAARDTYHRPKGLRSDWFDGRRRRTNALTFVWTAQGLLYRAVIIDLFSRRVVGWSTSQNVDRHLALAAPGHRPLCATAPAPRPRPPSDRWIPSPWELLRDLEDLAVALVEPVDKRIVDGQRHGVAGGRQVRVGARHPRRRPAPPAPHRRPWGYEAGERATAYRCCRRRARAGPARCRRRPSPASWPSRPPPPSWTPRRRCLFRRRTSRCWCCRPGCSRR